MTQAQRKTAEKYHKASARKCNGNLHEEAGFIKCDECKFAARLLNKASELNLED